ncbi:hypothetical protein [Paenibacillus agilis]|uniref:Uncharacterized protein n=1 Tax=Paenibacillus agilis TaxID=3020863 RepID=A0A559IEK3_9BACL|nr:hypothetical protein [Paenibacillus agilis]TVX86079.1 hypothetical protein FPZ44_24375 [Paenibacillus agilis]
MSYKNFDALRKAIMKKAKEGMQNSVLPVVQKQMKDSIESEVYSVYTPIEYNRREYSNGGLGDMNVMKGYALNEGKTGFDFLVQNEARASGGNGLVAPLIIKGQLWAITNNYILKHTKIPSYEKMLLKNSYGFTPFYEPRDFIGHTKDNLEKTKLAKKLNDYMNK